MTRWKRAVGPQTLRELIDPHTARAVTLLRLGSGGHVGDVGARPRVTLVLYQLENCPYSRKVREALSALDLDAKIRPCPKNGRRFRLELIERGGREQIPFLIDPNTNAALYGSDRIVRYLFRQYGSGRPPLALRLGRLGTLSSRLASTLRAGSGVHAEEAFVPDAPLELWSFEAHVGCRRVRERLDELELAYTLRNVAPGSLKRRALWRQSHTDDLPQLIDPNAGARVIGASDVLAHIERRYAQTPRDDQRGGVAAPHALGS